ncbi:DUF4382 domain-containing protein [Flavivirga jejuensis]|uniref:DUF4382 domain-containing protein n=1 Tax=Flavivirga jejuensis TaxID=870487 RepID=A0ABT8WR73_9FLAO|nr:DUF4382 domain-containing protein [Flavivirga jejuensis]MDO5975667.1 DUF4382 domain-containing protein [Flavivirga jejuensis]
MRIINKLKLPLLSIVFISLFGCNNSESNKENLPAPTITIKLVDESGNFEAVNVDVVDVMVKMNDDKSEWIPLDLNAKTLNSLNLTKGTNKVLVNKSAIPAGNLKQIKLVLGDNNTIVFKNGFDIDETLDLKTTMAQRSGLKLKLDALIEAGFTYDFVLDLNVDKSVVFSGKPGNISLSPIMRSMTEVSSGIIEGAVSPADEPTIVSVKDTKGTPETDDDEIISAYTNFVGYFALWGVPTGTYEVVLTPVDSNSKYKVTTISNIEVVNGQVTVLQPVL